MAAQRVCDYCGTVATLHAWSSERGTWLICRRCVLELRAAMKNRQLVESSAVIPEGCVYRFFFFDWLHRTGRMTEYPNLDRASNALSLANRPD